MQFTCLLTSKKAQVPIHPATSAMMIKDIDSIIHRWSLGACVFNAVQIVPSPRSTCSLCNLHLPPLAKFGSCFMSRSLSGCSGHFASTNIEFSTTCSPLCHLRYRFHDFHQSWNLCCLPRKTGMKWDSFVVRVTIDVCAIDLYDGSLWALIHVLVVEVPRLH